MNKNLEHYLFRKENFLDEKYCEDCIEELNKEVWAKHNWYNSKSDSPTSRSGDNEPEVVNIDTGSINVVKINDFIIKKLQLAIISYQQSLKFDWFSGWSGYTSIKFMRYYPGQTMLSHWDHIHDMFDGERKGVPTLSIIGTLNDDYEGGELIMFEDKKIDTKKGDLLIFPSSFLYPHKITPIIKGIRYSYQSWVW